MDFTLSLAHFCELHGPTSVLCTQALPASCSACHPISATSTPQSHPEGQAADPQSYFVWNKEKQPSSAGHGTFGISDGDRCASCRMSLPDDAGVDSSKSSDKIRSNKDRPPLRTQEEVHICGNGDCDSGHHDGHPHFLPESFRSTSTESSCHSHKLDYVSSSSPAESETFASLRRATVRTLSGEQLPRGQTSGPLWFGDSATGYTIAYVFRLADTHARGRQRYYALLALAGSDTQRAFSACTVIWNLFEQIANYIVQQAEDIASGSTNDSPPERGLITPISSFLTGRPRDPDGYPRGVASVRANGIAELVGNENFFCELHMMFVGILSELGKLLGGMRVKSPDQEIQEHSNEETKSISQMHCIETEGEPEIGDSDDMSENPTGVEIRSSDDTQSKLARYPSPLCGGPGGMVARRHQVAV